jgi:hypothetical protein
MRKKRGPILAIRRRFGMPVSSAIINHNLVVTNQTIPFSADHCAILIVPPAIYTSNIKKSIPNYNKKNDNNKYMQ